MDAYEKDLEMDREDDPLYDQARILSQQIEAQRAAIIERAQRRENEKNMDPTVKTINTAAGIILLQLNVSMWTLAALYLYHDVIVKYIIN